MPTRVAVLAKARSGSMSGPPGSTGPPSLRARLLSAVSLNVVARFRFVLQPKRRR